MTLSEKLSAEFDLFRSIKMQQPKSTVFASSFDIELRKRIAKYLISQEKNLDERCREAMICTPNLLDEACSFLRDEAYILSLPDEHFISQMEAWIKRFSEDEDQ